jgi:hypothetical protein
MTMAMTMTPVDLSVSSEPRLMVALNSIRFMLGVMLLLPMAALLPIYLVELLRYTPILMMSP